jgi:hypothetical protein
MKTKLSLAATLLSSAALTVAASPAHGQASSTTKPSAYGNTYQGVSRPAETPILADENAAPAPAAAPSTAPAAPGVAPAPAVVKTTAATNPDAGIVESPLSDPSSNTPMLQSHGVNPDADIVTEVQESPNELPQGTPFHARLLEEISGDTVTPGTPFSAQLTENIVHMGAVVIPVGSYIHGRVAYVSTGRRISGPSTMKLRPEEVVLPDGTHYFFRGIVTQTGGSDTRANAEGEVVAKGHPVKTAAEYGATAGTGAIVGGVMGGPVGAVTGAGIGAGLMTVHWLRERNAPVLPAGSRITFALSTPITFSSTVAGTMPADATAQNATPPPATVPAPDSPAPVSTYVEPKIQN